MELLGRPGSGVAAAAGLRKGAWTEDEDRLLRRCVETYGEGRWHQVPIRAGLNRCRKSCRLRWLNYLKPNIKRGEFLDDEVDLMIRLHNLLGNRWSLIAGRLPGRTANDVKNYWNTHQRKKKTTPSPCKPSYTENGTVARNKNNNSIRPQQLQITKTNIIKRRPRAFSPKYFCWAQKPAEPKKPILANKPNNNNYKLPPRRDDDSGGGGTTWMAQLETFLEDGINNTNQPVEENDGGGGGAGSTWMDHQQLERFPEDGIEFEYNGRVTTTESIGGHDETHDHEVNPFGQLMSSSSSMLPDCNEEKSMQTMSFGEDDDNYGSLWSDHVDIWQLLGDHHYI